MRPGLAAAPRALRARDERDALRIAVYCPHYQDAGGVREVVRRFSEDEGFLLASALSFGVVLCLPPFTLIFFSFA